MILSNVLAFCALLAAAASANSALAGEPRALPSYYEPNSSYLSDRNFQVNDSLIRVPMDDARYVSEKQQQYSDMMRDFEMRRQYGLMTQTEEIQYYQARSEYQMGLLGDIKNQQLQQRVDQLKRYSKTDPTIGALVTPVSVAAAAYMFYNGREYKTRLSDSTFFAAQAHGAKQRGRLSLRSPSLNAAIDLNALRSPAPANSSTQSKPDQVRVSASRGLPVFDLGAGVAYGVNSQNMTTSLSRQVFIPELTAVVDSTRSLEGNPASREDRARVEFGLRF